MAVWESLQNSGSWGQGGDKLCAGFYEVLPVLHPNDGLQWWILSMLRMTTSNLKLVGRQSSRSSRKETVCR